MDPIRVILSSHKKELTFINEGVIIYNTFNDSFLLIKKKCSSYYDHVMEGKYRLGLLPIMLKYFLPSEKILLRKCVEGSTFKDKKVIVPDLINRLIKDRNIILQYLNDINENIEEWEPPNYKHQYNSFEYPVVLDNVISDSDVIWRSTNKIENKSIDLYNNTIITKYHINVINVNIINDNIKWVKHLEDIGLTDVEASVKESIKISMNNIIYVSPAKVDMGKYIKEYIGCGSYSLLETGQTIIIVNDIIHNCMDLQLKLENLSKIYGQKFHHYYIAYGDKKDLVILLH